MNDPKVGVAKVTCPTFEAMGQIPMFHRTYFLFTINLVVCCSHVEKSLSKLTEVDYNHKSSLYSHKSPEKEKYTQVSCKIWLPNKIQLQSNFGITI